MTAFICEPMGFSLKSEIVSEIAIYSSLLVMFDMRPDRRFGRKSMPYRIVMRDRTTWYKRLKISRIRR